MDLSTLESRVRSVTRTPLLGKLLVLDLGLNLIAFLALQWTPPELMEEVTLLSLGMVVVLNVALVGWALQPLQALERTTRQVSMGDYDARTQMSWMADRNLVRIGHTLDELLDRVAHDRDRTRALGAQVVAAGDQERARIARELHDGTAQSLAALDMLLTATMSEVPEARERLMSMQQIIGEALQEVRTLCHDVHPRVLDDLGLRAALTSLVRRARGRSEATIVLAMEGLDRPLSRDVQSVVYRIVQESVHNALKHGSPSRIDVRVTETTSEVVLEVQDDGEGFDTRIEGEGLGLFVMDERAVLVDGTFEIDSAPGKGCLVRAVLPAEAA